MSVTFEEVMDFHPDNRDVYVEIRDSLGQLIPFVGAGLTADVYGTWGVALRELGGKLTDPRSVDELDGLLASEKYFEAADLLEERRDAFNFARDLAHHFSPSRLDEGGSWDKVQKGAIWLLPDIFACPVLTTNFDQAIELVYRRRGYEGFEALDPFSQDLRAQAIRLMGQPCVFKLHGTVTGSMVDSSRIVFTKAQYDEHYGPVGDAREALSDFIGRRALLFLGCSLRDDATVDVLKDAEGSGVTHYAIVGCERDERDERIRELAKARIRLILYKDGEHDSTRVILDELLTGFDTGNSGDTQHGVTGRWAPTTFIDDEREGKAIRNINKRLDAERENHPSFLLLTKGPSRSLMPQGETKAEAYEQQNNTLIPNAKRTVTSEGRRALSFEEFMKESWDKDKQTHLYITGTAGIGKTVALLTFATEPGFLPKRVPAVYIPVHELAEVTDSDCIEGFLRKRFGAREEEYQIILELSEKQWAHGPNVILLMDGYNEITKAAEKRIGPSIREWAKKPGTQIVATSRKVGLSTLSMRRLRLEELGTDVVRKYLSDNKLPTPDEGCDLWGVIHTPLMLKLYTDYASFKEQFSENSWLKLRKPTNSGNLIWDYLLTELYGCCVCHPEPGCNESDYIYALLLVLPYICWRMERVGDYDIDHSTFIGYLEDGCDYWSGTRRPRYIEEMEFDLGKEYYNKPQEIKAVVQRAVFEGGSAIYQRRGNRFVLTHQRFRDALAAMHLNNTMSLGGVTDE